MARSSGSIHIADNSVTAINDAIQQLLFMIDELRGEHDTTDILVGPHSHGATSGGLISHDTGLSDVSSDDHHTEDHQTRHNEGGLDELKLDDLGTPDDNTDLNANVGAHGLLPKLSGNASEFLNGAGAFTGVTAAEATDIAMAEAQLSEELWEKVHSNDGTVTITKQGNADAIDLSASGGSSGGKQYTLMMAEL